MSARPTQNRAKIAIFNMLDSIFTETKHNITCVWDAFAGSGAFGLECLSRYDNAKIIFTDTDEDSVRVINKNLSMLKYDNDINVGRMDALSVVTKYATNSDMIFIDPPYSQAWLADKLIKKLEQVVKDGTIVVFEQENGSSHNQISDNWNILRDKTYGRARFLILRYEPKEKS